MTVTFSFVGQYNCVTLHIVSSQKLMSSLHDTQLAEHNGALSKTLILES